MSTVLAVYVPRPLISSHYVFLLGAVVPITNTRNVVATLVHLAHNPKVSEKVQKMSCEALATIGLWLQTLAGSGTVPEGAPKSLLPTHKTVGWERWA